MILRIWRSHLSFKKKLGFLFFVPLYSYLDATKNSVPHITSNCCQMNISLFLSSLEKWAISKRWWVLKNVTMYVEIVTKYYHTVKYFWKFTNSIKPINIQTVTAEAFLSTWESILNIRKWYRIHPTPFGGFPRKRLALISTRYCYVTEVITVYVLGSFWMPFSVPCASFLWGGYLNLFTLFLQMIQRYFCIRQSGANIKFYVIQGYLFCKYNTLEIRVSINSFHFFNLMNKFKEFIINYFMNCH